MIIKYEKLTTEVIDKEEVSTKIEVDKKDATHIHYCGHDEVPQKPCRRVKL